MPLKTPAEYVESMRDLSIRAYVGGERVDSIVAHPSIAPHPPIPPVPPIPTYCAWNWQSSSTRSPAMCQWR